MIGNKLRSWMEAVRPRKKQYRKEKKSNISAPLSPLNETSAKTGLTREESRTQNGDRSDQVHGASTKQPTAPPGSRYSAANLSSPESAYSTGYSTDGTSPGAASAEYCCIAETAVQSKAVVSTTRRLPKLLTTDDPRGYRPTGDAAPVATSDVEVEADERNNWSTGRLGGRIGQFAGQSQPPSDDNSRLNVVHEKESRSDILQGNTISNRLNDIMPGMPSITSPRQRNRIRTNPWVPNAPVSPGLGTHLRVTQQKPYLTVGAVGSPLSSRQGQRLIRAGSPRKKEKVRGDTSSSSSSPCISPLNLPSVGLSDPELDGDGEGEGEEECTLNEMMGRYDESYVYEKETDILSDSDPTDCDTETGTETDIDTGRDGGDEDEPLDYIDNGGSCTDLPQLAIPQGDKATRNTGHCTYHHHQYGSRRRTTRRSKHGSTRSQRRPFVPSITALSGSRSAGATPLSVRRNKHRQTAVSKLALDDRLRRRSNSVSFSHDPIGCIIEKRDKEADTKYKELIVEADNILNSLKTGTNLSPRRLPTPANKRVEILRNAESTRPDFFLKSRPNEDYTNVQVNKFPSIIYNSPRFSPKRNHITNFIHNNSQVPLRREISDNKIQTPRRSAEMFSEIVSHKYKQHQKYDARHSPKYKRKFKCKQSCFGGSDSEQDTKFLDCPQSEPLRRKVYNVHGKSVAFCLNNINEARHFEQQCRRYEGSGSAENLRQQVLMNTIVNLKKNLQDQSASLKRIYQEPTSNVWL